MRAAQWSECVARVIDELAVGAERFEDRVLDVAEIAEVARARGEPRCDCLAVAQVLAQPAKRSSRGGDGDELGCIERCSFADAIDRRGDVRDVSQRQRCITRCKCARLGDLRGAGSSVVDRIPRVVAQRLAQCSTSVGQPTSSYAFIAPDS
jgi:hypothetical protein